MRYYSKDLGHIENPVLATIYGGDVQALLGGTIQDSGGDQGPQGHCRKGSDQRQEWHKRLCVVCAICTIPSKTGSLSVLRRPLCLNRVHWSC